MCLNLPNLPTCTRNEFFLWKVKKSTTTFMMYSVHVHVFPYTVIFAGIDVFIIKKEYNSFIFKCFSVIIHDAFMLNPDRECPVVCL